MVASRGFLVPPLWEHAVAPIVCYNKQVQHTHRPMNRFAPHLLVFGFVAHAVLLTPSLWIGITTLAEVANREPAPVMVEFMKD